DARALRLQYGDLDTARSYLRLALGVIGLVAAHGIVGEAQHRAIARLEGIGAHIETTIAAAFRAAQLRHLAEIGRIALAGRASDLEDETPARFIDAVHALARQE